jgi:hypothetical protein
LFDFTEFLGKVAEVVGLKVVGLEIDGLIAARVWRARVIESEWVKATLNLWSWSYNSLCRRFGRRCEIHIEITEVIVGF